MDHHTAGEGAQIEIFFHEKVHFDLKIFLQVNSLEQFQHSSHFPSLLYKQNIGKEGPRNYHRGGKILHKQKQSKSLNLRRKYFYQHTR